MGRRCGVTLCGNALPDLPCAGQRWKMTVRLRPVHSQLNVGLPDGQRFACATSFANRAFYVGRSIRPDVQLPRSLSGIVERTLDAFPGSR